ncbi:arrestin domain-containing protein [Aspergillus indologenus CBS 114.80]|uniref:Arrestin domain-containing protein n=1 Tax=Aspergillus indologenus CBS 114.80 TaxID=1450541 RepID=A0A2V5IA71_9EURO|nr:arrestin domain-containing protein [Aspergillus indologenus CBS 114.80]
MLRSPFSTPRKSTQEVPIQGDATGLRLELNITEPALFAPTISDKPAVLRGECRVTVKEAVTVKRLTVNLRGTSHIVWPHGIRERRTVTDNTLILLGPEATDPVLPCYLDSIQKTSSYRQAHKGTTLWNAISARVGSSGREEQDTGSKHQRLTPGTHIYKFEMVLRSHLPESIQVRQSEVRYRIRASIERTGLLNRTCFCSKPITVVHCPAEDFVDDAEPIYIARAWKHLLQSDILVSRRGAPLGDLVPVTVSYTELGHAKFRGLQIFVSEDVQYHQRDGLTCCSGPFKRSLVYEKMAGPVSTTALRRADTDEHPAYIEKDDYITAKTVGDAEARSRSLHDGDTEHTELCLQLPIPVCHLHSDPARPQGMHFDTRYKNVRIIHWLEFAFLMAKPDKLNPNNERIVQKVAHVPLALRSCYAQQANAALPAYS